MAAPQPLAHNAARRERRQVPGLTGLPEASQRVLPVAVGWTTMISELPIGLMTRLARARQFFTKETKIFRSIWFGVGFHGLRYPRLDRARVA
jgi:hypothetical protein